VDRQLAALVRSGAVRRFKLSSGRDEYGLLLRDDYAAQAAGACADACSRAATPAHAEALRAAFAAFQRRVLPACRGVAVGTTEFKRLLRGDDAGAAAEDASDTPQAPPLSERAADDALAALMSAGLVVRAMEPGADALLFCAPNTARLRFA
jgi:hypothetical protein